MGIHDRDYQRQQTPARPPLPPVTKWLLIVNLVIFFLEILTSPGEVARGPLCVYGSFRVSTGLLGGHLWQLLSFQFLHASLGHVVFNGIGLFVFGPFVERFLGSRKFIAYYLLCGISGGLFYSLLFFIGILPNAVLDTPLVGASAGIFGLIFAVYQLAPAVKVRLLFPPVTLTMRQLALALAGWAVAMIVGGLLFPHNGFFWNSGGEAGHLGGALMGLLLMKFPKLIRWAEGPDTTIVRPKEFRKKRRNIVSDPKMKPRTEVDLASESEVDRILEKISANGIGSLTAEERKILDRATKQ